MTYREAVLFMQSALQYGSRPGLKSIERLCGLLSDPQDKLAFVHVAGTNGKGSISAMSASILFSAGYKTGLYLSPYLNDYCDSMQIDGETVSHDAFADIVAQVKMQAQKMAEEGEHPTEFEILTAVAFLWFYQNGCDIVVLETGMGGRLDATNIIKHPLAAVITSISMDHTAYLGDTIDKIAHEKCGIIKPVGITVSYPQQNDEVLTIIKEYAEKNNNVFCIPDMAKAEAEFSGIDGTDMNYRGIELHVPLSGKHQVSNAVTAIEMALALNKHTLFHIAKSDIISGIGNTKLPARQEVLRRHPLIILDGAHNIDGIKTLAGSIQANLSGRKIVAVMGMLKDKDYEESIGMIAGLCSNFIAVKPDNPRALNVAAAAEEAKKYCAKVAACDDYAAAVKLALQYAGEDGAIVICGSLYLAGPMRNIVLNYFKSL